MSHQENLLLMLVFLCAGLSFLMSGMEAGIFALSPLRVRQLKRSGDPRAEVLHRFLERPENFIWTILVGNTLTNFTIVSYVVIFLVQAIKGQLLLKILLFAVFLFLFYVGFELLPKMLFRLYPNRLCLLLARPFRAVHFLLSPLVALVEWIAHGLLRWTGGKRFTGSIFGNRDELRFVMQESSQTLTTEEKAMINRVLDLQNRTLRHVMIPFAQVTAVTTETPMREVLDLTRSKRLTRFPVWKKDAASQRIVGLVSLKTWLYAASMDETKPAGEFVKPAIYLAEDLRLEDALHRLRGSGQRMAIVLGRDQREIGIVTLQDILQAIFGEVSL